MAFSNEFIKSVQDIERYNSFNFVCPLDKKRKEPWKWTIDRERDVFLVDLGGQGRSRSEIPAFYAVVCQDVVALFEGFYSKKLLMKK